MLATVSVISVSLVLLDKWQRPVGPLRALTFGLLLTWALALPWVAHTQLGLHKLEAGKALVIGLVVLVTASIDVLVVAMLGGKPKRFNELAELLKSPFRIFALMVIVAPICEEYIFRGFVLQTSLPLGVAAAIAISTTLFVIAHLDLTGAPYLAVAGVLFALAALAGGLITAIAAHAVANLLGFGLLRVLEATGYFRRFAIASGGAMIDTPFGQSR